MEENESIVAVLSPQAQLLQKLQFACRGLKNVSAEELVSLSVANFYEGIKEKEVDLSNILAARAKIELDPAYAKVASDANTTLIVPSNMTEVSALITSAMKMVQVK